MSYSSIIKAILFTVISISITSCRTESAELLFASNDAQAQAVYDTELSAIINDKCLSCHEYHLEGVSRYDTYDKTKSSIAQIINRVNSTGNDAMPPADSPQLTDEELAVFNNFLETLSSPTEEEVTEDLRPIAVDWVAYKYPNFYEREGVGGTFDNMEYTLNMDYTNLVDILLGAQITINTASVNVANNDALRTGNVSMFFEYFTPDIMATIVSYNDTEAVISFQMNEITLNETFSVEVDDENNVVELIGSIADLALFNWQEGHDALEEVCGELHEGKLWPDVYIKARINIDEL